MTYEEAKELFYSNEKIQEQFDFNEIDYLFSQIDTVISDIEDIMEE